MISSSEIRRGFCGYFAARDHKVLPSAPVVPKDDATLLFTNAGMVPFKAAFMGLAAPPSPRVATVQQCLRAGGKHNDLDQVGRTARHHTFFEMLGNFSFGDYFKERAMTLAWDFLVGELALDVRRLWVTVFAEDEESERLWRGVSGLPASRIIPVKGEDNFWSMGDSGPCGPCSEIFYDHGAHLAGALPGSGDGGERFVELWNLVFMQYDQGAGGRVALRQAGVDTGMGLERLAAVLQGVRDNYATDQFLALREAVSSLSGVDDAEGASFSHRVLSDHIRAGCFLISGGVAPSNEGRGYVLRRILRRAVRHAHLLGCREPLLFRLAPVVVATMKDAWPELARAEGLIRETLRVEEEGFLATLERGLHLLSQARGRLSQGGVLSGETAFLLHDTYGFPLDLTQDILRREGLSVDTDGFARAMAQQKERGRSSWRGGALVGERALWQGLFERHGATVFSGEDVGRGAPCSYPAFTSPLVALVKDGAVVAAASAGEDVAVVVGATPFYGESGGQQGDRGVLRAVGGKAYVEVLDTQKRAGGRLLAHRGIVRGGKLRVGEVVSLEVELLRRRRLAAAHSATHLLHEALRRCLGDHVAQRGSLVAEERLRFDFSHSGALGEEALAAVALAVNARIRANDEVVIRRRGYKEALSDGALALSGGRYGDEVRVVAMGVGDGGGRPFSLELCGGSHVSRTGDIGWFVVTGQGAVASGVRRIEALVGAAAQAHVASSLNVLRALTAALNCGAADAVARLAALRAQAAASSSSSGASSRASSGSSSRASSGASSGSSSRASSRPSSATPAAANGVRRTTIGDMGFASRIVKAARARELKGMAEGLGRQLGSGVAVVVSSFDGKGSLAVCVHGAAGGRVDAVALARIGASALGGRGAGGRPDLAAGGGPGEDLARAVGDIEAYLRARRS